MKKIPTLFVRDEQDRSKVTDEITPGCDWVLAGEGVATRKYDGTCVMFDGTAWWARREVKPGKSAPASFQLVETDNITGKSVGWEPVEQSPFAKFHVEALDQMRVMRQQPDPGTYELVGPKINGNPEKADVHTLVRHATAETVGTWGWDYGMITQLVTRLGEEGWEGIVWHHPDGRMAKLKVRDL